MVRAERPGFDSEKEIALTVADCLLRIHAERTELKRERAHSEFHYGQFARSIALPAAAIELTATARYADGVLKAAARSAR